MNGSSFFEVSVITVENMEGTRKEEVFPVDDCRVYCSTHVSVKQEPLDVDVFSHTNYLTYNNQTEDSHVHCLPLETCMQQELATCDGEAIVVKTEDVTESTLLGEVMQTGIRSRLCKVDTEPITVGKCTSISCTLKTEMPMMDFVRPDSCSTTLAAEEIPFPVALYQHERIQSAGETMTYKHEREKSHRNVTLESTVTMATSSCQVTSDNVTSEQGFESEKQMHLCSNSSIQKCSPVGHIRKTQTCLKGDCSADQQRDVVRHMRTQTSEKPYKCSTCNYGSSYKRGLVEHTRTHTREKPYKCSRCDYCARTKSNLANHRRSHTGEKPYKCSICSYSSAFHHNVRSHMRTHTGEKPFKCSICDYSGAKKSSLVAHMRTHTGKKPYKCSICDYSTAHKHSVVKHMRTHTGEKPYKCSICDYSAATKNTLVDHVRTHTGEKPYKCSICDYRATKNSTLLLHVRSHTGEKPYKCSICDYRAAQKNIIVNHMKKKHWRETVSAVKAE